MFILIIVSALIYNHFQGLVIKLVKNSAQWSAVSISFKETYPAGFSLPKSTLIEPQLSNIFLQKGASFSPSQLCFGPINCSGKLCHFAILGKSLSENDQLVGHDAPKS